MSAESKLASVAEIHEKSFDFVIIGGGTSGCVLANRLSEDPNISVVVLEAGKCRPDDPLIVRPMGWMRQMQDPEYDWNFAVTPQKNAATAHLTRWNRGKSLGGSSSINIMAFNKPAKEDIDVLETLGNPGWNWESYQKYALKSERFYPPKNEILDKDFRNLYDPASLGDKGPLSLSFVPTGSGADGAFQKSLEKNGVNILHDAHGGKVIGAWKSLSTINPDLGSRADAFTAYLVPALGRSNLKILTEATVHRLLIKDETEGVTAQGVEFEHNGQVYKVLASREVILCAGALKSPQLLELSGIGDRKVLEPLGIHTVIDLPGVGNNAQEHMSCLTPVFRMKEGQGIVTTNMLFDEVARTTLLKSLNLDVDYNLIINNFSFMPLRAVSDKAATIIEKQKARLTEIWPSLPNGLRKQYETQLRFLESNDVADVELMCSPLVARAFPEPDKPHVSLLPTLTHPFSRGTVHITSTDPYTNPQMDPHYFEEDVDLDILGEAFKFALRVAETEPFRDLIQYRVLPPPEADLSTDEKIKEWVSGSINTTFHTCSTAAMLPRELDGVVDPELKVYGTRNLRIVDLSILPLHITVHPQSTVYAFAEKAADIIKASYASSKA